MARSNRPRLFGVCFVKNEEDIIADSMEHAAQFCDKVFVVDNASSDRTWEIVRKLDLKNLVPVCSKDFVFRDYLRLRFMDTKKEELGLNNWWYIFDADEFLLDDPFDAIAQAEEEGADCIAVSVINFLLTKEEVRDVEENGPMFFMNLARSSSLRTPSMLTILYAILSLSALSRNAHSDCS
jgi:hypothetical protein